MDEVKIEIAGLRYDNLTMRQARDRVLEYAKGGVECDGERRCAMVVTPNAEIAQLCLERAEMRELFCGADLALADGSGVVLAGKILGKKLVGRVPGVDLAAEVLPECARRGYGVFLLGGAPGVAERAADKVIQTHPGLTISGTSDGFFDDEDAVVRQIRESGARVVFVCLGAPKQELFIKNHRREVGAGVMLGLGGTLDALAGDVKRAPKLFRRTGTEWLYRLIKQPSRIGRMLRLPKYIINVTAIRLKWRKI